MFHFRLITPFGIRHVAQCPQHFIFGQLFHTFGNVSIEGPTLDIPVNGVTPAFINLLDRMVISKFTL